MIFKYLLPPTNPVTLSFATIYVQSSVEDTIRENLTAFSSNFILLDLSKTKKERRDFYVSLQSSLKLELSRSTLMACAQQRKVLVPLINQMWKMCCICQLCCDGLNGYWFPLRNNSPMKAATMDNRVSNNSKYHWLGPKSAFAATT